MLYAAALNEFPVWETALGYAGVNVRNVGQRRVPTPKRICQQLSRLCTSGYDLGAKVSRSRDRAFFDAVLQHFGSWRAALTAAGINLTNVSRRRPKHLDREVRG